MLKNLVAIFALTVLFSTIGVQSAFAAPGDLYAAESGFGTGDPGAVKIIDTVTGFETLVGDDRSKLSGLAFDNDSKLFGNIPGQGSGDTLVEIDSITGLTIASFPISDGINLRSITDLTVHPVTNQLWGVTGNNDSVGAGILLTIDKNTGFATEMGTIGIPAPNGGGLAFSLDGNVLYYSDVATGIFYELSPFSLSPFDSFLTFNDLEDVIIFDGLGVRGDGKVFGTPSGGITGIYPINVILDFAEPVIPTIATYSDLDFHPIPQVFGSISGFKFNDVNENGIWDQPAELTVPNTEICLYDEDSIFGEPELFSSFLQPAYAGVFGGEPIPLECVLTDGNGFYQFDNVQFPAFYYVTETLQAGQIQTFPASGDCYIFGEIPSSDFFNSEAHCVDFFDVPIVTDLNFGNTQGASLHGMKTIDTDGDGIGDEPRSFVTIEACKITPTNLECELFDEQNFFQTRTMFDNFSTPEDETGQFWLTVPAGDYRIQERAPFGTSQIVPADGAPYFVTVAKGDVVANLDFVNQNIPPGQIQGSKFQDANGNGIKDAGETGVSGISFCLTPSNICVQTNPNGDFTFFSVPAGQYSLNEILPSGSVNTTPLIVPVNVISGQTTIVAPFGNTAPVPANPEVTVGPLNSWGSGGLPSVYWQNNITVSKDTSFGFDHCGVSVSPTAVTLQLEFTETNETIPIILVQDPTNPDVFTTVPALEPFFPRHGVLNLNFDVFCPDGTIEFQQGGSVYIDPSGQITDVCTDEPLAGAEVTLLKEFPPGTGLFVIAAESDYIQDTGSVQTTGADGRYGWDTVPGVYKVSVSAAGFITQESPEVPIPPPELELDLVLDRVDACPVDGDALRELKESTVTDLENIDTDDKKATKEIAKAIKSINKSIADKLWDDSTTLSEKHGHKVFDEEKKAVKSLLKAEKRDSSIDVSGVIATLVEVDRQLAQNAIDEAGAFAGDKKVDKEIDKANDAMAKALDKLNDDKPDKAIDQYKKAWKHAQKALEKALDDDDDDDEDEEDDDDEDDDEEDEED